MKKENIDFDEAKKDLQRIFDSRFVKIVVGTAATVAVIYIAGKVIHVITQTVIEYNGLKNAIKPPSSSPKNGSQP